RFPDPYTPQELLPYELIWDMAEYFIRFIPKKDSLYLRLLLKLYESGSAFALSTLNYDCLLIRVVNYLDHYFPSCQYTTCFPHGNAAFFCEGLLSPSGVATANAKSPIEYHINSNGHLVSNGKLGIIESLSHLRKLRVDYLLSPPVLCHINPAKFAMSGANIIDEQQLNFRKLISRAEKIAIIGTSVNENDEHIWSPLAQTNAQILYVSGSSSVDGFLEWAAKHQRAQDKVRRAYWSEAETDVYKFLEV
ncbi:MAG: hypothetical protein KDK78_06890, partial [Chlamydiia bacterium]|nr:hypothetical protein [Chlamydiia bacterium]